jgi:hypothetical protein
MVIAWNFQRAINLLQKQRGIRLIVIGVYLFLLLFPIRQAFSGQLRGTFSYNPVPLEYKQLEQLLSAQSNFFRTMWVPTQSRFRFQSEQHPTLVAQDVFNISSQSAMIQIFKNKSTEELIKKFSVKYIIIPYDSSSEIFLTDRKYDSKKRQKIEKTLDGLPWLKKIPYRNITLYELVKTQDHFWIDNNNISYKRISESKYTIPINISSEKTLVFSEAYHPKWVGIVDNKKIESIQTKNGLNSFELPKGNYLLEIVFTPQQYHIYFYIFSGVIFSVIVLFLVLSNKQKTLR